MEQLSPLGLSCESTMCVFFCEYFRAHSRNGTHPLMLSPDLDLIVQKRCDPCSAYYSWQMFILNTLLDFFAALVLFSSGCHFGFEPPCHTFVSLERPA